MRPKRHLYAAGLLFLLLFLPFAGSAQFNPLDSINQQLRQIFSPLFRPAPVKEFLYDMSGHVTDHPFTRHN